MDPRYTQANAAPEAFNPYLYAQQHNAAAAAALNRNQELSAAAAEFIPNFKPTPNPSGDWNYQAHHQDTPQVFPPAQHVFPAPQNHSRPFPQQQQQQAPFQRNFPVYPQQQQQSNRNFRPDLIQNHHSHHHHQNYSNHHQQQPQSHYMMMNQQQHGHNNYPQQQQQQQQQHGQQHAGNGGGGDYGMSSIQNRLNFNNSHAPEPVIPHEPMPHKQTETEQLALDYLSEVIAKLNDNPGLFENYQKKLRDMFVELVDNHFVMSNVIENIFEQSINEQNFRYTGARLCLLFDSLDLSPGSTFRSLLIMKMEFQNTEQISFMQNEQRKVRGNTMFLAELFVQLSRPEDTRGAFDVSRYVLNSIMLLLSKPGPENVKCVCQSLKLSGYDLQKENPTEVEEAINQLKSIAEGQNIQSKRLIQSVVDLFYDNWGRKDEVENPPSMSSDQLPAHLQSNQYNDSPVFYGPDGQIISEEESSFLNSNMPESYPINIDEIIDDDSDDFADEEDEPEMDLEMQMAYKEFIKAGNDASRKKE